MTEQQEKSMLLSDLLPSEKLAQDATVKGLAIDSRQVKKDYLFAAIKGVKVDGYDYIPQALEQGASVILTDKREDEGLDVGSAVLIKDNNPRKKLAGLAALFSKFQPGCLSAVTGTNGKSSVASFARAIWQQLGHSSASVGTLGVDSDDYKIEGSLTTPDSISLHQHLSNLSQAGVTHAALEASSHGLDQFRVDGCDVKIAAFTNLTRDHMDYHGSEEDYFTAKARLFTEVLRKDGTAVIFLHEKWGERLVEMMKERGIKTITVGEDARSEICLLDIETNGPSQSITIGYRTKMFDLEIPLAGRFQAWNMAVAAGIVIASGEKPEEVFNCLPKLKAVPGRMELAGKTPSGGHIYVDYAHTPDGLEHALRSARGMGSGKLGVVFGCGGDRDKGKRPQMGEIAARLADRVYVTDDNPRSENAATIRSEILAACPGAGDFSSREKAIEMAVKDLEEGDVLVVSGKGHETGQIVGDKVLPFDDFAAIKMALNALSGQVSMDLDS